MKLGHYVIIMIKKTVSLPVLDPDIIMFWMGVLVLLVGQNNSDKVFLLKSNLCDLAHKAFA